MTRRCALALCFALAACSGATNPNPNVVYPELGQDCSDGGASLCDGGACFLFGNGSQRCTLPCSSPSDCPSGSQGTKCNGKGYCAP